MSTLPEHGRDAPGWCEHADLRRAAELLAYQIVCTEQIGPPEGTALEHFRRMPADRAWEIAMRLVAEAERKYEWAQEVGLAAHEAPGGPAREARRTLDEV